MTQAGRGGMEWLAGGRLPSWASPYSAAATAALKAQFPTQWPTIRDYGFAHPEIVGYMNAYAPEDAKIAYSLVEGIGFRYWQKSQSSDYFDLGVILKGASTGVRVSYKLKGTNLGSNVSIFGARSGYGSNDFSINFGAWSFGTFYIGYGGSHSEPSVPRDTNRHTVSINKGVVTVDSWSKNYGVSNFQTPGTAWLFANRNGDNHPVNPLCVMDKCEMWENDVVSHIFVPIKRNGVMELLDLVSGNLATRVGTFTELIESPS